MMPSDRQRPKSPQPEFGLSRLPDYQSRSGRWRLFVLVAALMLVLVAMNEARQPRNWTWLWSGAPQGEPIDTQLPTAPEPQEPLAGTIMPSTNSVEPPVGRWDPKQQVWYQVWGSLSYQEKEQLSHFLRTARRGDRFTSEGTLVCESLRTRLDQLWTAEIENRNRDLILISQEGSADLRRQALLSLVEIETAWANLWKPAFDTAAAGREWNVHERAGLAEVESILDLIALTVVRDDTVWRPEERTAFFRQFEKLKESSPAEISALSLGNVGFVQLFQQPEVYRGKVVTVRGTARSAFRVSAPPNDLGIQQYFLFWTQPDDGSNQPIVVYALDAPPGFPAISSEKQEFHEPISATGYFFKRWVYRAADGLNSVPLVIARSPEWQPTPVTKTMTDELTEWLGPYTWPALLGGVALLGLTAFGVVLLVKWSTRPSRVLADLRAEDQFAAKKGEGWKDLPSTLSVEDSLKDLENSHRNDQDESRDS